MKKFFLSNIFFLLILTLSVFAVYGKSAFFGFSYYDDDTLILNNADFISDIKNIPHFFTESCFHSGNYLYYRPVLTISFSIESLLFKITPEIYHFNNILLFIAAVFLIYFLLLKLNFNRHLSKFIVFLFSLHPIFTSCAVWIPARNDTLLIIFVCVSLISFINYINSNEIKFFVFQCLAFAAALFTKETGIVLIFIYFMIVYCFNYKITKKQIFNNLYILLIILLYFVMRARAVPGIDFIYFIADLKTTAATTATGLMTYISKFIFPDYMPVILYNITPDTKTIFINITAILMLLMIFHRKYIERKILLFGFFWIAAFLIPTFIQKDYVFMLHRFMPASIGAIIIITAVTEKLSKNYKFFKIYSVLLFVFLTVIFSYLSYYNANKYKDADIFWKNAYADAENYHVACQGLAKRYLYSGNYSKAKELLFEAKKLKNLYAYDLDIASVSIAEGNFDEAENRLLRLIKLKENFIALKYLSEIYFVKGDIEKSHVYAEKAFKLNPNDKRLTEHIKKLQSQSLNN